MKIKKDSLAFSAGVYTLANMLNAGIPFLMLPLLTRYLTPAEYGLIGMFQVLVNGLLPFVGLNHTGAISRQFFEKDKIDFPSYLSNTLYLLFGSSIAVAFVFWAFGGFISGLSDFPVEWLWAVVLFAFADKLAETILTLWRVNHQAINFGAFRVLRSCLDVGLSIYFVIVLKRSWEGRVEGQVIAVTFFAILAAYYLWKGGWFKSGINKEYLRHAVRFGAPLIPHTLGAVIITYSDRLFITNMVGLTEMGLYNAGYQVGLIIGLFQNSFNQAWVPWFYSRLKEGKEAVKRKIVMFTYGYFVVIAIGAWILSEIGPWIFDIFLGKDFYSAQQFVFWIGMGFAFNGMYKMVVNYLFFMERTRIIGTMTLITSFINIGLNYVLISEFEEVGAAQATMISFGVQFILMWIFAARAYKMPWFSFFKNT